jgi:hypothetical protein
MEIAMRGFVAASLAAVLLGATGSASAQLQASPDTHPAPIVQGQNDTPVAPPGGIDQQGMATPTAAAPPPSGALQPGAPAGDERAADLSKGDLVAAGVAVTAAVVCAVACFSNSTSTTTSTTVVHH